MNVIGHRKILDFLNQSIKNGKVSHSYLFVGPDNIGKFRAAQEFISKLCRVELSSLGNNPDISIIEQEGGVGDIKINQIRQLKHYLSLSPYELEYKIAILDNVSYLNREAANALLKTLEEPSGKTVLILIASEIKKILPTIISRCQIIRFYPVSEKEMISGFNKVSDNAALIKEAIELSAGRPGLVIKMLDDKDYYLERQEILNDLKQLIDYDLVQKFEYVKEIYKEKSANILNEWLFYFRENLRYKLGILSESVFKSDFSVNKLNIIIKKIIFTKNLIEDTNVNNLLAMENLLLAIDDDYDK